jgi:carboxyl-terminal processing protease
MNRLSKAIVVSLSLLVFGYVSLGYVLGKTDDDKTYRSLTVYGEVLQHIQEDYVDQPDLSAVTAGSLHGLLESLDPYSAYLSPREYSDYKEKQKNPPRGEVGVTLAKRFGYAMVVSVLPDSPAEKTGLRAGDILEAIAGFTTRDMSVPQADALLDGAPGTTVKAAVVRRGFTEPQDMEMSRAVLTAPHILADKIDDVAYLRIPALGQGSAAELRDKLTQFDKQGVHKLVLDLRDCATGQASEAVSAAQLFVPSGTISVVSGQTASRKQFDAAPDKVVWRAPVEVLISDSTSGAAEVLAAAIGDNHRADLVGERTFGTAAEQKLIPLEDGSAVILTVAYYYTPSGKAIIVDGVVPTVQVVLPTPDVDDDAAATAPIPPPVKEPSLTDPVIKKALDLLKAGVAPGAQKAA